MNKRQRKKLAKKNSQIPKMWGRSTMENPLRMWGRSRMEDLLSEMMRSSFAQDRIANMMAAPLRVPMDYSHVGRRLVHVEHIPAMDVAVYDHDIMHVDIETSNGHACSVSEPRFVGRMPVRRDVEVLPPPFVNHTFDAINFILPTGRSLRVYDGDPIDPFEN